MQKYLEKLLSLGFAKNSLSVLKASQFRDLEVVAEQRVMNYGKGIN